jgi:hypothetical protein
MPICMSPRSSAVSTSAEVRCGTTGIGIPAIERSSSPVTFWVLPGLMVPTLNLRIGARGVERLLQRAQRRVSLDQHQQVELRHGRDRREGGGGIERHRLEQRLGQRDATREHEQGVTVRRRRGDGAGGDDAARPGPVLDHHLGVGALGEFVRQQADGDVGKAARSERHDDADRPARVRRLCLRGDGRYGAEEKGDQHARRPETQCSLPFKFFRRPVRSLL